MPSEDRKEIVESPVISELKSLIGVELKTHHFEVEKGHLRRFAEAIGDPNPEWQTKAPPTFLFIIGPHEVNEQINPILDKSDLRRRLNAGNELDYYKPIMVGDIISYYGKLVDFYEKEGKSGKMLFTISEVIYKNQKGEVVGKGQFTFIRY